METGALSNGVSWVPLIVVGVGVLSTLFNAILAFSIRSWTDRILRLENAHEKHAAEVARIELASARDGATRKDLERIQDHLAGQDKSLQAIHILLAKMVPGADFSR